MAEEEKGFEIRDKRKVREALDTEGAAGPSDDAGPKPDVQDAGPAEQPAGQEKPSEQVDWAGSSPGDEHALPPLDFLSFVGSLAATAFMYMGERLSPDQPEAFVDLKGARQMIDLLDLIKTKTKGNLEQHEAEGLDSILYNLRMRYLHESRK